MNELTEWMLAFQNVFSGVVGNPSLAGIANVHGVTEGCPKPVVTSTIVKVNGRIVKTRSGSIYMLKGEPNRLFLADLQKKGFDYNKDRPLDCYLGQWIRL